MMMSKYNHDTGLVQLPKGHFWRIRKVGTFPDDFFSVEWHKPAPRWYDKNRTEVVASRNFTSYFAKNALKMTEYVYSEYMDKIALTEMLGDYPPKKYNGGK